MKLYRKFLFIFWMFVTGCVAGGFDITQPLIKLDSEPIAGPFERVSWFDYDDEEVNRLPSTVDGCVLFYFKTELSCWECDALDDSFKDDRVVHLLIQHFLSYKATNDMDDYQIGLSRMGVRAGDIPHVSIAKFGELTSVVLLEHRVGLISTDELIDMILGVLDICKEGN